MFEEQMEKKLKRIFKVKKVSYDEPGDSQEQDCLFINVENAMNKISRPKATSKVTGSAVMFANNEKLPFGYLSKCISEAEYEDVRHFHFSEIEDNTRRYQNIVQRGFSFVYFFSGQYDPKVGTITSVNLTEEITS